MMKIAMFVDNLNVGGIQKSVVNIMNNMDSKKYEIDLYLHSDKIFFDLNPNVKFKKLKKTPYILKFIPFKLAYKLYRPKITDKEYDLAIDFDGYQFFTASETLSAKAKKRAIWIHNDMKLTLKNEFKYRLLYFFFKKKYNCFDSVCAVSEGAMNSFNKLNKNKKIERLVIPNYIDTLEIKQKMDETCDLKIDNNVINIVTVAALFRQKGLDIMLRNMKKLTKYRTDFHLYIIGKGPEKNKLLRLAKKLGISDKVTFVGAVKNPFKYLKQMDLFYLTSRYEGQGMVLLEALSVGVDVLIPKHLEKYCPWIKGEEDTVQYLIEYKKGKIKEFNDLKEYNDAITKQLEKLLELN